MKQRHGSSTYGPRAYDQQLDVLVDRLKRKYGFQPGSEGRPDPPKPIRPAAQLSLGLG